MRSAENTHNLDQGYGVIALDKITRLITAAVMLVVSQARAQENVEPILEMEIPELQAKIYRLTDDVVEKCGEDAAEGKIFTFSSGEAVFHLPDLVKIEGFESDGRPKNVTVLKDRSQVRDCVEDTLGL